MRSTQLLSFALLVAASAAAAKPAAKPAPDDYGSVVALSPFEVTARSMEFSHWLKLSSPHFVLYTDVSAKEANLIVKHFEMVHQASQFFLKRKALNLPPIIVVLPTARSDWRKIGSKGHVEWKVASSLVGSSRNLLLVQYDWQSDGLSSVFALLGLREVHAMNLSGPLWFSRGIASFFRTVAFDRDTLTIGKQGGDAFWLHRDGWLKWDRFFTIDASSTEFTKDTAVLYQYEGQCGVFVHQLLTSSDPTATGRLLAWAAYLEAGNPPTEQSFRQIFEHDWAGWEQQLRDMLNGGSYTVGNIRFPPAALQFPIENTRPAVREMRELFVLSQILNQDTKDSDASLDTLLVRGLKTDALAEVLADACASRKRDDARMTQLRALIAAGSVNPAVYADAARLLFNRGGRKCEIDTRLTDEASEIRSWCAKAREFEPLYVKANELLAWTEALAPTVEKRNADTIASICRTLDGHAATDEALAALAVARWRLGNAKQARALAERVIGSTLSRKLAKTIASDLLARLDAAPVATVPPTPVAAPVSSTP